MILVAKELVEGTRTSFGRGCKNANEDEKGSNDEVREGWKTVHSPLVGW